MKWCLYILSVCCCFAQLPGGMRSPGTLGQYYRPLSSNEIFALGPIMWLMADVGVYNDDGTTLAANGDSVQRWADVSGNGNNANQQTAAKKPTFYNPYINGTAAIHFGGNDSLTNILAGGKKGPIKFIFALVYPTNVSSGQIISSMDSSSSFQIYLSSGTYTLSTVLAGALGFGLAKANGTALLELYCATNYPETNYVGTRAWYNERFKIQRGSTGDSTTGFRIGESPGGGALFYGGGIIEIILFTRTLPEDYRKGVELYLKKKWNVMYEK